MLNKEFSKRITLLVVSNSTFNAFSRLDVSVFLSDLHEKASRLTKNTKSKDFCTILIIQIVLVVHYTASNEKIMKSQSNGTKVSASFIKNAKP